MSAVPERDLKKRIHQALKEHAKTKRLRPRRSPASEVEAVRVFLEELLGPVGRMPEATDRADRDGD